ncbi:MAG: HAMP domain-containing sensor histidine kinase [Cellulophaga sp.]
MKNKTTILITVAILALLSLSVIQAYLINNTYQLKNRAFTQEADDAISDIDNIYKLDSLFDIWSEDLQNHLADYKNSRITKEEVVKRLKIKADSLDLRYNNYYRQEVKALNLGYELRHKKKIKSILIFEGLHVDTIFVSKKDNNLKLFGENFEETNAKIINVSRLFNEHEFVQRDGENITMSSFDLEVKMESLMLIKDSKSIVLRRMISLLLISVFIFLFVTSLFYYSIKSLINQKKIAAIKTDFINNITHELKTPLATLGIATKILKSEEIKNSPEAFTNTLHIVDRQNNRLQKLIDQVMTNSLSATEIVLSKEQIIDNTYFNNLIEDFKLATQHNAIVIKNDVFVPEVLLRIDTFHFTTALLNILDNAVKYGKEGTEIIIKTVLKNNDYVISISDNGLGISVKDQEYIFDKFFRVNEGNVHDVKGLGLGLYYTSQIVKTHHGSISIESQPNKGAIFTIKIPIL